MNWFKKKEKNKLLVSCSHIKSLDEDYDIGQVIEKSSSNLPKWWSTLKPTKQITPKIVFDALDQGRDPITIRQTTKTCPSFINLFNNSYIIKCPTDLYISIEGDSYKYYSLNPDLVSLTSHPLSQINNHLNGLFFNLKFDIF